MVAGEERERGDGYRTVELSDFAMILGSSNWRMTGGLDVIIESFFLCELKMEINHLSVLCMMRLRLL